MGAEHQRTGVKPAGSGSSGVGAALESLANGASDLYQWTVRGVCNFAEDCSRLHEFRDRYRAENPEPDWHRGHAHQHQQPAAAAATEPAQTSVSTMLEGAYAKISAAVSSAASWAADFAWGRFGSGEGTEAEQTTRQEGAAAGRETETGNSLLETAMTIGQSLRDGFSKLLSGISSGLEQLNGASSAQEAKQTLAEMRKKIRDYDRQHAETEERVMKLLSADQGINPETRVEVISRLTELREQIEKMQKQIRERTEEIEKEVNNSQAPEEFKEKVCEHGRCFRRDADEKLAPMAAEIDRLTRELAENRITPDECCSRLAGLQTQMREDVQPFLLRRGIQYHTDIQTDVLRLGVSPQLLEKLAEINSRYQAVMIKDFDDVNAAFNTANLALNRYQRALSEQWTPGSVNDGYGVSNLWFYPELKRLLEETKINFLMVGDAVQQAFTQAETILDQQQLKGFERFEMSEVVEARHGEFCRPILSAAASRDSEIETETRRVRETLEERGQTVVSDLRGEVSPVEKLRAETIET